MYLEFGEVEDNRMVECLKKVADVILIFVSCCRHSCKYVMNWDV